MYMRLPPVPASKKPSSPKKHKKSHAHNNHINSADVLDLEERGPFQFKLIDIQNSLYAQRSSDIINFKMKIINHSVYFVYSYADGYINLYKSHWLFETTEHLGLYIRKLHEGSVGIMPAPLLVCSFLAFPQNRRCNFVNIIAKYGN